jgi:integrase
MPEAHVVVRRRTACRPRRQAPPGHPSRIRSAKAAAEARADLGSGYRKGILADDGRLTLGEWLQRHYSAKTTRGDLRPSTIAAYRILLAKYVIPQLGGYRLGQLRGHHLTAAYASILTDRAEEIAAAERRNERWRRANPGSTARPYSVPKQLSASTVARVHAVVSGALAAAVKAGLVPTNVASAAELPKPSAPKVRPWTPEVFGTFLDAIEGERLRPFFVVAGFCGLRRGELAGLRWSSVDLTAGRLTVVEQRISVGYEILTGPPKSDAGADRRVWLAGVVVDTLRAWRRQQTAERLTAGPAWVDTAGLVFTNELGNGYHPEYYTKLFARLTRKHGLPPARLHSLRHLAASLLINSGLDIAPVSKLIGHSSIQVTSDVYGHMFDKAGRDAAERAAALVRTTPQRTKIPSIP